MLVMILLVMILLVMILLLLSRFLSKIIGLTIETFGCERKANYIAFSCMANT